jgi:phage terminase large subunit-like protein
MAELKILETEDKLSTYRPYPKQAEFHNSHARERMLMAGNQLGKTLSASFEVAMHLTGIYPDWYQGRRFDRPVRWLAGSESAELTRKGIQRLLLGPPEVEEQWGTGSIPKAHLAGWARRQGVADAVSTITVHTVFGGISSIQLATYDQGRTKWQADTIDGVWFDEEPPEDIYFEGMTRTNAVTGPVMTTLTPLMGVSGIVRRFYIEKAAGTHLTMMTIDDVTHYTDEQRNAIIASYPEFERKARTQGIPQLGSGRVFPLGREAIACPSFAIPEHWPQICGIDFGWDHPSAGVRLAWDRDNDAIYVIAAHRAREQTPMMFAGATKPWGDWLPWSWPHDGKASGGKFDTKDQQQLQQLYKNHGLKMLAMNAQFEDGTNGVEAGITDMLERMQTGRWKVFSHLADWFEEFELYHRKDGLIVKLNDDLISASRYALMMKRFAVTRKQTVKRFVPAAAPQPQGWMG